MDKYEKRYDFLQFNVKTFKLINSMKIQRNVQKYRNNRVIYPKAILVQAVLLFICDIIALVQNLLLNFLDCTQQIQLGIKQVQLYLKMNQKQSKQSKYTYMIEGRVHYSPPAAKSKPFIVKQQEKDYKGISERICFSDSQSDFSDNGQTSLCKRPLNEKSPLILKNQIDDNIDDPKFKQAGPTTTRTNKSSQGIRADNKADNQSKPLLRSLESSSKKQNLYKKQMAKKIYSFKFEHQEDYDEQEEEEWNLQVISKKMKNNWRENQSQQTDK